MNKQEFIQKLAKELSYTEEKCIVINDVLENHFFISKKSKDKIVEELIQLLTIDSEEATRIYDAAVMIVQNEVKNKCKHPFKNKD